MSAKVYVRLPKAGLGNMMLTWSRAFVFAKLNNLEICISSWTSFHWGALLRFERKKRLYIGYFLQDNFLKRLRFFFYFKTKEKVKEPPVQKLENIDSNRLFIFEKIFTDNDFFKDIRPYKDIVKKGIVEMLHPKLKVLYTQYTKPVIGIHVRRGDFKRGSTITPISFFTDVITKLRSETNSDLPVTLFTDAQPGEIKEIIALGNVSIAEIKPDILDILLLADSEIVVLSTGSTFSYWAAFLSDGTIIKNKAEWHIPFRSASDENFTKELFW